MGAIVRGSKLGFTVAVIPSECAEAAGGWMTIVGVDRIEEAMAKIRDIDDLS
jgi:hypothetical protein